MTSKALQGTTPIATKSISNATKFLIFIYQYAFILRQKIAEFAIILELNGYSGCMEIG